MKPCLLLCVALLLLPVAARSQTPPLLAVWGSDGSGPGQFHHPTGVAVGADDTYNNRIQVFGSPPTPAKTTNWGQLKAAYR